MPETSTHLYLFVAAIVTNADILSEDAPGAIRFVHHFLEAENDDDAYSEGGRWLASLHKFRPQLETINDYVIDLGKGVDSYFEV